MKTDSFGLRERTNMKEQFPAASALLADSNAGLNASTLKMREEIRAARDFPRAGPRRRALPRKPDRNVLACVVHAPCEQP
jgi:hypothetical protein